MTTERIDVLAVLDAEITQDSMGVKPRSEALAEARAAVAELIDACNEYGPAVAKAEAAGLLYGEESNCAQMREARGGAIRAAQRYRLALSRVQS